MLQPRRPAQFIVPLLVSLWACSGGSKRYIENGNRAFEAKHFEEASLQYRKAIQKESSSSAAYYRLGLSELKLGKVGESVDALQHAVDLAPQNPEPKVALSGLLLAAYLGSDDRPADLASRLTRIADALLAQDANSYEGLKLKGCLSLADGNAGEAIGYLQKADQAKPAQPETIEVLAAALIRNGQAAEGEQKALDLIPKHKDYGPIYDVLYEYYATHNRAADAEKIVRLRAANNPGNADFAVQLVAYLNRARKPAEAQALLQRLTDTPSEFPEGRLKVGAYYESQQKWAEALNVYRQGQQADPSRQSQYSKRMASILIAEGRREEAMSLVDQVLKQGPKDTEAKIVRANLLMDRGKPETIDTALRELQSLLHENRQDTHLSFEIGKAYAAKGDRKTARASFQDAVPNPGTYVQAHMALAELDQHEQNWPSMQQHADFALLMDPTNASAKLLRATAAAGMGDFAKAEIDVKALLRAVPQYRDARIELGYLELNQKRYKDAESCFRNEFRPGKEDTGPLGGLVETYLAQREYDRAFQLLDGELQATPQSTGVRYLLADAAFRAGNVAVAEAQYRGLLPQTPSSATLYVRLGAVLYEKGDDAAAIAGFRKAQSIDPSDTLPAIMLATVTGKPEDQDKAIALCRQALKEDPNDSSAQNNLAFMITEKGGNLGEALEMAQKAAEARPWQSHFVDTLGYVMAKNGMPDQALVTLDKLVHEHPESPTFHYHYAYALVTKGDRPHALSELQSALAEHPSRLDKRLIQELLAQVN